MEGPDGSGPIIFEVTPGLRIPILATLGAVCAGVAAQGTARVPRASRPFNARQSMVMVAPHHLPVGRLGQPSLSFGYWAG